MKFIELNDVKIAVNIGGKGDNVLFVSGLGGRASFWDKTNQDLKKEFNIISYDHRGCGQSSRSKIKYSIEQMSIDTIKIMDQLSIEKVHFVGHSTGGAIGQFIALNFPDKINKLVLSSSWAGPNPYFLNLFQSRRNILNQGNAELYLTDGILRSYPPKYLSENPEIISSTTAERLEMFPGIEIEDSRINAVLQHDLRTEIHKIKHKTLIICASDDQITPVELSEELAENIPNTEKRILPFGGHFTPHTQAKKYNDCILKFLKNGG
jgi:aminoacrylate hydrolase